MVIYTSNYTKDEIDEGVGLGLASPLNIYKSIVTAICASSIDGFTVTETTNAEWAYVLTDSEDRVMAGIRTDGSLFVADIDSRDTMGSYTIAQINDAVTLANSAYQKPQGGIPASDLASDVLPGDFGASGTNHAHGLVPDPGSNQGTSRFLREDGTWVNPIVEGLSVATVSSAASMSIAADKVTIVSGDVGTAAITLTVPNDNNAHVWDILMTTDSTVAVTLAMSDNGTILYPDGYVLNADTVYEINVIGTNGTYYLRYGEFVTS